MSSKQTKGPIDELIHLSQHNQQILFAGFVRNKASKSQVDKLLTSAIFIINIFAEFIAEKWNQSMKSKHIVIDGISVSLPESGYIEKSVYCSNIIKSGRHKWTFKYDKIEINNWNLIGIWKTRKGDAALEKHFLNIKDNGYAYCGPQRCLTNPRKPGNGGKLYGDRNCQSGDIIEMILDLNDYTLCYTLNGKNQGIAFKNIEATTYQAAVTLYQDNDKISLLSFETI